MNVLHSHNCCNTANMLTITPPRSKQTDYANIHHWHRFFFLKITIWNILHHGIFWHCRIDKAEYATLSQEADVCRVSLNVLSCDGNVDISVFDTESRTAYFIVSITHCGYNVSAILTSGLHQVLLAPGSHHVISKRKQKIRPTK